MKKTYLDNFLDILSKDKNTSYELLKNIFDIGSVFFNNNGTEICFYKESYKYDEDKNEDELNEYYDLFKQYIDKLIKEYITWDYIKNDCIKILENKLITDKLNDIDIFVLKLYWLLNNINDIQEFYLNQYFQNQSEREIIITWNNES